MYQIEITASGTHAVDGFKSDTETYWFAVGDGTVVPEPTPLAMLGLGAVALLRRTRRT